MPRLPFPGGERKDDWSGVRAGSREERGIPVPRTTPQVQSYETSGEYLVNLDKNSGIILTAFFLRDLYVSKKLLQLNRQLHC
jgi:hypothetical protein